MYRNFPTCNGYGKECSVLWSVAAFDYTWLQHLQTPDTTGISVMLFAFHSLLLQRVVYCDA